MKIDELLPGIHIKGIEQGTFVTITAVVPVSDTSINLIYTLPDGSLKQRLISQSEADHLSTEIAQQPWSFTGNSKDFRLALEAKRIDFAYLFDPMMAVYASNVQPLPHQISAVYEAMLPKQPIRYILADDPGAGKTIMAGLLIQELIMRSDIERVLIVCPGSLVEQWHDELLEKFSLNFDIYVPQADNTTPTGNYFADKDRLIVRLDQFARDEEKQARLAASGWDMVVFDEAHKLAAHFFNNDIKETQRFKFARLMSDNTRHLLLMTATPHNGKEEDFQQFLSLLDSDRFELKHAFKGEKVNVDDIMRRMVKEDLRKFDGTPLFPERRAYTVSYKLSEQEMALYEDVTDYVKNQMGLADKIANKKKKNSVGFALTSLQRRLASSPEAIYKSLDRRIERLEKELDNLVNGKTKNTAATLTDALDFNGMDDDYDSDDLDSEEQENLDNEVTDSATAAQTKEELIKEIEILKGLKSSAKGVVDSKNDSKWVQLSGIIQGTHDTSEKNLLLDANGKMKKLIIFTEYKDTLLYLKTRIENLLGQGGDTVVTISGSTKRSERLDIQERFRTDEDVRILIATDAAGEGVNLQNAHLMINYDLPWNPNRLEQRFGRIHRIGQTEVCHLWSLVASETREGEVYQKLLLKIEEECKALNGRVFKILGDLFQEKSLKDMLLEAIQYGDRPDVKARLINDIDLSFNPEKIKMLLEQNALSSQVMNNEALYKIKDMMDRAEAKKMQPYYIQSFFMEAFKSLNGSVSATGTRRYKINNVPACIIQKYHDLKIKGTRKNIEFAPVQKKYEAVCFDKEAVHQNGKPPAQLLHPGHPLMVSLINCILDEDTNLLQQGAVFLDKNEFETEPYIIYMLTHEIHDGTGIIISKNIQFVRLNKDGTTGNAGYAPHLDLYDFPEDKKQLISQLLAEDWVAHDFSARIMSRSADTLCKEHLEEVSAQRIPYLDKVKAQVNDRLNSEINYFRAQMERFEKQGEKGRGNYVQAESRCMELVERRKSRFAEIDKQKVMVNQQPVILGAALVVPAHYLSMMDFADKGITPPKDTIDYGLDAEARKRAEQAGMDAVAAIEIKLGNTPRDVSKFGDKCGYDISSKTPDRGNLIGENRLIEVKTRVNVEDYITVTCNECLAALNKKEQFYLAVVLVEPKTLKVTDVYYWKSPIEHELNEGTRSINIEITAVKKNGIKVL